jgi:hydrogenase/urease accessory protein HupE
MLKLIVACWLWACLLSTAWSDDIQPMYVEVNEKASEVNEQQKHLYQVAWRIPATFKPRNYPAIVLPKFCHVAPGLVGVAKPQRFYQCNGTLAGQVIQLRYPLYNPSTSTLIKYRALSGEQHTRLLSPSENRWVIPIAETPSRIAQDYTILGMKHIWAGTDHLLFLLCLLWVAGNLRRVLITITGFTLAHSLTLVTSALEWVRLPVPPVEAVIALSIVFLATEIVKDNKNTLTWRYPIAVSSSFGFLHGFGFAAALAEIGLPQTELLTGLVFFNIGVEVGQVVVSCVALMLIVLLKRFVAPWLMRNDYEPQVRSISAYCIGGVASFWLVGRCVGFVS